jgi:hypothetical protein
MRQREIDILQDRGQARQTDACNAFLLDSILAESQPAVWTQGAKEENQNGSEM